MYFNGAVLLCIFTGGAVGYFIFGVRRQHCADELKLELTSHPVPRLALVDIAAAARHCY